jgi:hypothetical protein
MHSPTSAEVPAGDTETLTGEEKEVTVLVAADSWEDVERDKSSGTGMMVML